MSGLGETLQRVRLERGLSLRTLASRAGFSPSFLSQVENGQTSPSIASLEKLAANLGLRLVDFFAEMDAVPDAELDVVGRAPLRQQITSEWSQSSIEPLVPRGALQRLAGIVITVAAAGRSGREPSAAASEQLIVVLEGRLALTLGERSLVLEHGDAAAIPAGTAHRWENRGPEPARVLLVGVR